MSIRAPEKSGFEKWKDGINKARGNPAWDKYDCEIQFAVSVYNQHLSDMPGYVPLDWHLIKAILWVESGAGSKAWGSKPMQIGNPGDPGLGAFLSGKEGGDLILPPIWKGQITTASARTLPIHNIKAGIGYLLMRAAHYGSHTISKDSEIHEVTVKLGDSLEKIAKAQGSTVQKMKELNPKVTILRPGQVLKYQKASIQQVITGWRTINTQFVASRYNVGDIMYVKKLDYALAIIRKVEVVLCA
jgi:hypothetical protein